MTPKEKAKELVGLFTRFSSPDDEDGKWESWHLKRKKNAKQCALIAVAEIFEYLTTSSDVQVSMFAIEYWQQVEQEIEQL
jgi:hypothetical protein